MANHGVTMRSIRQVLQQAWEAKLSQDEVHRTCGISKGAVNRYLKLAQAAGLSWPLPKGLDDEALERLLRAKKRPVEAKFVTLRIPGD